MKEMELIELLQQMMELLLITLVSPEGGVITVKGLSEGHYVIEETKAPDGYAKLKNTINKTISDR